MCFCYPSERSTVAFFPQLRYGVVFIKGFFSIRLNSSLHWITWHQTQDISGCYLGEGAGVGLKFVSSRFELHFCGAWPQNLARRCLSLCLRSFCLFGCEPAETQGRVCLCGFFSVMHPRRRHSRQISLHPRIVVFPPLCILSFLFVSVGSVPQNDRLPHLD